MKKVILLICMSGIFSSCYTKKYRLSQKENIALRDQITNLNTRLDKSTLECKNTTLKTLEDGYKMSQYMVNHNLDYKKVISKLEGGNECCNHINPNMKIPAFDILKMIAAYRNERYDRVNYNVNNIIHPNPSNIQEDGDNFTNNLLYSDYQKNTDNVFLDSRGITFNLDTIQNFICSIKNKIESNRLNITFAGLRFYYIVYDTSSKYAKNIEPTNQNQQSILIMPTFYDIENKSYNDFDPELFDNNLQDSKRKPYKLDISVLNSNPLINALIINIQNKGSLCPPPHGGCEGYNLMKSADIIYPCRLKIATDENCN